ncbi:MAG: hypothetical protein QG646_192 [Euryarchaeota archaeon]|nr:hypothetical protein [Euryarchaeota archaeon]
MDNHVFISYVRDNEKEVQKLCEELANSGVEVWLDRNNIEPGVDWKQAISKAIQNGAFFIACFSQEYYSCDRDHMNEELALAIEELRLRPTNHTWFIPVLLSECNIPVCSIGEGKTLLDIQWVNLYYSPIYWELGVWRIVDAISSPSFLRVDEVIEALGLLSTSRNISDIDNRILSLTMDVLKAVNIDDNRLDITRSLGKIKIGKPALPTLIQALGDENVRVRKYAAMTLGKIGDPSAIPALTQALSDKDEDCLLCLLRGYAAEALGKIGDYSVVPALIQALSDKNGWLTDHAVSALREIGTPEAIKAIEEFYDRKIKEFETYKGS